MADTSTQTTSDKQYTDATAAYADKEAIKSLVRKKKDEWAKGREGFVRAAWRNILFYQGVQWITWDRAISRWRPSRLPRNTPTPVTNVFASTMDAVMSVLSRVEPQLNFRPGSEDEPDDRATADVAVRAIGVVEDEVSIRLTRQILAVWVGLTGIAWLETGYDNDPIHGMTLIDVLACSQCGYTEPLSDTAEPGDTPDVVPGQPQDTPTAAPPASPMAAPAPTPCPECGAPMAPSQQEAPRGQMYTDVATVFEMYFDPSIVVWSKQRAYIREKSLPIEESKARWPQIADRIQANVMDNEAGWYADNLPTLAPQIDEAQTRRVLTTPRAQNTKVTEEWYWQLPDATYPDGLLAVIIGKNLVAYNGPLPYSAKGENGDRVPFLPHICFPQKLVPGSGYGKTVANDLAAKQAQRNRWESIIEACGMRMGSPVWLKPNGANVTNLTGDPGNIISYNAVGPGAAKPERLPGQPIPIAFIEYIDRIDKTFEELAATFDVVKGQRPEGVSAGIALQILQERNLSRYGPLFILWEQAWAEWARQALEIFREFATEPRLMRIKGRDGRWQVQKFLGADLQGRVDVMPEAASSNPRSTLLDRAEMEQLAAMGVINPRDPEMQYKFLEVFGRTSLTPAMALDTKNAFMENEAFSALAADPRISQATPDQMTIMSQMPYPAIAAALQGEQPPLKIPKVRPSIDDHSIHLREHRNYAKSESYSELPEALQALVEKHIEFHQQLLVAQAQAMQNPAGVAGGYMQPSPGAPAPRQSPMHGASSGAGLQGQAEEMQHGAVTSGGV